MLKAAFEEDQKPEEEQGKTYQSSLSYGSYTPFTAALTHLIDNKAGIGWTSFGHTAIPVPIYALGVGAEDFAGSFHDSQIYNKMKDKMDVEELQKKIKKIVIPSLSFALAISSIEFIPAPSGRLATRWGFLSV